MNTDSKNVETKQCTIPSVSGSFFEDLQKAFNAGRKFEIGEQDSEKTYNKFTGYQEPNREKNFENWFKSNYR